jgi:hypothetical protein
MRQRVSSSKDDDATEEELVQARGTTWPYVRLTSPQDDNLDDGIWFRRHAQPELLLAVRRGQFSEQGVRDMLHRINEDPRIREMFPMTYTACARPLAWRTLNPHFLDEPEWSFFDVRKVDGLLARQYLLDIIDRTHLFLQALEYVRKLGDFELGFYAAEFGVRRTSSSTPKLLFLRADGLGMIPFPHASSMVAVLNQPWDFLGQDDDYARFMVHMHFTAKRAMQTQSWEHVRDMPAQLTRTVVDAFADHPRGRELSVYCAETSK